jgi:hypothetical protein
VNFYGNSVWSNKNTYGAQVRSVPTVMGPLSVLNKTESEITLVWSTLVGIATGNSPVTSYNLYWDDNKGNIDIRLVSDLVQQFTIKGTTGGFSYKF